MGHHPARTLARGEDRALEVDRQRLLDLFLGDRGGHACAVHPGIGDHCVDRAEGRFGGIEAGDDIGLARDIHLHGGCRRPDLGCQRGEPVRPACAQRDLGPARGENAPEARAEARGCTRDERLAPGQFEGKAHGAAHFAAGSSPFTYFIKVVWKWRTRLSW